ncbi:GGDEF domain-containing protein [Butyribacter intestini]|jgi:diguanylate cyclase (GGDEF)-like protein|uniref:GGDEF domain-containing protein n=1 Tax=Butyribacter intestini TaxID=1703332 RepID=UPI0022DFD497|nr:GGDEF domain-containing protein [Butyribacter intestini]
MDRCKDILCQIFGKSPISDEKDVAQNIYTFRFVLFCMIIYTFEEILNATGIFIVDKKIFVTGYIIACFFLLIHIVSLLVLGLDNPKTKYLSIFAIICVFNAASISLTYHMIIIIMIPLVIAGMYTSKRISVFTFVLTIFSIILITYAGYFYGVCDANMALLTATSIGHLEKDGKFLMTQVNPNPFFTIGLYFVLPRCFLAVAFAYVSNSVNKVIRNSQKKAVQMELKASMDEMTGLYNKNRLLALLDEKVYDSQNIAVIYWDVNRLKYVNDNFGHIAGDRLIIKVAEAIRSSARKEDAAFRYGGDEFVMIINDGTVEIVQEILKRWESAIGKAAEGCNFPVSASVGYAIGERKYLEDVIAAADKNMYMCKHKVHEELSF